MTTLLIADHDGTALSPAASRVATAALSLGAPVELLLIGGAATLAEDAARIAGISRVLRIDATPDAPVEAVAAQIAALVRARELGAVVAAASSTGKDLMPRLAGLLDVMILADVTVIEAPDVFERPIYAGNARTRLRSHDAIKVVTVRATAFAPAEATTVVAPVETLAFEVAGAPARRLVSRALAANERPDLGSARIVVSGGRALGSAEKFGEVLGPLADRLGAALGATRAAVDAGYAPNDWQVGQTGKVVAPELYIAAGISGAIQHLAGMKDSKVIVAINTDPEAPIFSVADYGLVGDVFAEVPKLIQALAAPRS